MTLGALGHENQQSTLEQCVAIAQGEDSPGHGVNHLHCLQHGAQTSTLLQPDFVTQAAGVCFCCTAGNTPLILPKFCQTAFRCLCLHLSCTCDCMRRAVSGQRENRLSSMGTGEPGGKAKNANRLLWAALKSHQVPSGYFVRVKYCSDSSSLTCPWQQ